MLPYEMIEFMKIAIDNNIEKSSQLVPRHTIT